MGCEFLSQYLPHCNIVRLLRESVVMIYVPENNSENV
jgi:hypothetical protein